MADSAMRLAKKDFEGLSAEIRGVLDGLPEDRSAALRQNFSDVVEQIHAALDYLLLQRSSVNPLLLQVELLDQTTSTLAQLREAAIAYRDSPTLDEPPQSAINQRLEQLLGMLGQWPSSDAGREEILRAVVLEAVDGLEPVPNW